MKHLTEPHYRHLRARIPWYRRVDWERLGFMVFTLFISTWLWLAVLSQIPRLLEKAMGVMP